MTIAGVPAAADTDELPEGDTNLYYTNARVASYLANTSNYLTLQAIPNSLLTFAKMQNISSQALLGRYDAGSGVIQTITLGSGLNLSAGGVLSSTSTGGVSSVNTRTGDVFLTAADVGLGNVDNTSDANKPISTATQTALNLKVNTSLLGVSNGVATLDAGGKLPTAQLPPLAITDTFPVNSQAEMLALTAERGDVAVRTDNSKTYILAAEPASTLSNWVEITSPGAVTSVNGYSGAVSLTKSDIGLGNVDNTSDLNKPVSTATQTAINDAVATREPTITAGTTAQYWRGDKTWQALPTSLPPLGSAGGDLTGTYPNPAIATKAVTYAKFQDVPALSLLGNTTNDVGSIGAISIGSGLTLNAGTLSASGAVTSVVGQTGAVTASQIATGLNTLTNSLNLATLQNIAATSLLGNSSVSSAAPSTISIGSNLLLENGTLSAVLEGAGSAVFTTTAEQLTTNKTLTANSHFFQILNPNGSDRTITLNTGWTGLIINDSSGANKLSLSDGSGEVAALSAISNIKCAWVSYTGSEYFVICLVKFQEASSGGINLTKAQIATLKRMQAIGR